MLRPTRISCCLSFAVLVVAALVPPLAAASLFDDLAVNPDGLAVTEEPQTVVPEDGATPFESGAILTVRGVIERSGDGLSLRDATSGATFTLVGFDGTASTGGAATELTGRLDLAFDGDDESATPRLVLVSDGGRSGGPFDLQSIAQFLKFLNPLGTAQADENPYYDIVFPGSVMTEGTRFVNMYAAYRTKAFQFLAAQYQKSHGSATPSKVGYSTITSLNKQAYGKYRADYDAAIDACDTYIAACERAGVFRGVDASKTYIHMDKRTGLLRVVQPSTGETLLCVPFAYGGNPDGGAKQRNGDYRTPSVGADLATPARTPFFVGRRVPNTAAAGMTTRCMGVSSKRKSDAYWVSHGMNIAIHGTPDKWSMGLRASHGCCRVIDKHVVRVYELTATGTAIVIRGLE